MKLTKVFNLYNAIRLLAAAAVIYGIYTLVKPEHYRNKKEHFAAFTTPPLTSIDQLDPNTYYMVGTLQQTNTTAEARNGGASCVEFPTTIYVPATRTDATCLSNANPPVLDDSYYTFTESGVLGSAVFPRFFTSRIAINIPLTSTTADTAVKSISYNTAGTVLIVGNTSGVVYWSSNFGTSSQSFNPVNTGVVKFNQASIGNGVAIAGGRMTPTNDNLLYAGNISPGNINGGSMAAIDNRGTYYNGTQTVIGTVPGIQGFTAGVGDNVFLTIGTDGNVYLQQQGVSWFTMRWNQQPARASSISLDRTVATVLQYTPAAGTTLSSSIIFMASIQPGSGVATAPGGIGVEVGSLNTVAFRRVTGNPNNINYLCAGEDLRAFAITDTGGIMICNNITTASSPSNWVNVPLTTNPPRFSKIFYRQTLNDIAYAIDTTGAVYVQTGINALFRQLFNLTV